MSLMPTEHTARDAPMWLVHTACICGVKLNNNKSKLWRQINLKQKKSWIHLDVTTELVSNHVILDTKWVYVMCLFTIPYLRWSYELIQSRQKTATQYVVLWIFDFWELQRCNNASWPPKQNLLLLGVRMCVSNLSTASANTQDDEHKNLPGNINIHLS